MYKIKPVGYLLSQTMMVFKSQMVTEFKNRNAELTVEQFVILHLLESNGSIIQQDLANLMQKDKSIIVRQINGLLEKSYINRQTNKEDKRKKNLILTDTGLDSLKRMRLISFDVTQKLLSGVTNGDVEIFRDVLNKIIGNGCVEKDHPCCFNKI